MEWLGEWKMTRKDEVLWYSKDFLLEDVTLLWSSEFWDGVHDSEGLAGCL